MAVGETIIIREVTEMLESLLTGLTVTFDSPSALRISTANNEEGEKKVNLYLYQVLENPFAKNQPWVTTNSHQKEYPPLALNLYYLLTPYASFPLDAHEVLGNAMQLLYDNSLLEKHQLPGALRLGVERLAITLCPLKLEELTRIWNALQSPYRLSVAYEVKIVLVESGIQKPIHRVEQKMNLYSRELVSGNQ